MSFLLVVNLKKLGSLRLGGSFGIPWLSAALPLLSRTTKMMKLFYNCQPYPKLYQKAKNYLLTWNRY